MNGTGLNARAYLAALLIFGLGASCILLRLHSIHSAPPEDESRLWDARILIRSVPDSVRVPLPRESGGFRIVHERLELTNLTGEISSDRVLTARIREPDRSGRLEFEFRIRIRNGLEPARDPVRPQHRVVKRDEWVLARAERLKDLGWSARVAEILSLSRETKPKRPAQARRTMALLRATGVPARLVSGVRLDEGARDGHDIWVEAWSGKSWSVVDFETGDRIAFSRDTALLMRPSLPVRVRVRKRFVSEGTPGVPPLLDLTRLPTGLQDALIFALLMPLGGLVTSIFRAFLNIRTFGYFTPTLIALGFLHAYWVTGLVVFFTLMIVGLSGREFMDRLSLTRRPRLSLVLLILALAISMITSLVYELDLSLSSRGVFLPMVALALMVEHFHIHAEKEGRRNAHRRLGWTLVAAAAALVLFRLPGVQETLLHFPESLCFVAVALILVGRYRLAPQEKTE